MLDAILAIALAAQIHRTDAAVVATAYAVRDKVRISCRPAINKIIRAPDPLDGVWRILELLE